MRWKILRRATASCTATTIRFQKRNGPTVSRLPASSPATQSDRIRLVTSFVVVGWWKPIRKECRYLFQHLRRTMSRSNRWRPARLIVRPIGLIMTGAVPHGANNFALGNAVPFIVCFRWPKVIISTLPIANIGWSPPTGYGASRENLICLSYPKGLCLNLGFTVSTRALIQAVLPRPKGNFESSTLFNHVRCFTI